MKFPNIYRVITDPLRSSFSEARGFKKITKKNSKIFKKLKFQWLVTLYLVTAVLVLILSFDLLSSLQKQKEINFEKEKIRSEIKLWEDLSQKYPNYSEAYFQLAILNYKLGEFKSAKYYVDKALYLNPDFEKARNLKETLRGY